MQIILTFQITFPTIFQAQMIEILIISKWNRLIFFNQMNVHVLRSTNEPIHRIPKIWKALAEQLSIWLRSNAWIFDAWWFKMRIYSLYPLIVTPFTVITNFVVFICGCMFIWFIFRIYLSIALSIWWKSWLAHHVGLFTFEKKRKKPNCEKKNEKMWKEKWTERHSTQCESTKMYNIIYQTTKYVEVQPTRNCSMVSKVSFSTSTYTVSAVFTVIYLFIVIEKHRTTVWTLNASRSIEWKCLENNDTDPVRVKVDKCGQNKVR